MRSIAYHQFRKELHIINFARSCISSSRQNAHLRCDEIQHGYAVLMIYTLTRDDIPSLSAWIKKSDKSKLVGFFGPPEGIRTPDLQNRNLLRYPAAPRTDAITKRRSNRRLMLSNHSANARSNQILPISIAL